ncbi:MAG: cysteine desulfurase family protein [Rhodospirillaceae bacterium]|nr:cysteine desulfurase family protein [Rhodospirillaceae bacterium]
MPAGTRVYLDHNASAPLRPEAAAAMTATFTITGNPSSVHREGQALRASIEAARADVAALVGCAPEEVVFTSGATEANAMAIGGRAGRVICSGIEHPSVIENIIKIKVLPSNSQGKIKLDHLADELAQLPADGSNHGTAVALMAANNETGVIQPLALAAALCRENGVWLHVDAVQLVGKADLAPVWALCDSLSLSSHKIGGPTGVGALIVRKGRFLERLIGGGGQEMKRRAGTENVPGIVGFGVASRLSRGEIDDWSRIRAQRDRLEEEMRRHVPEVSIFGDEADRLPNTTCAAVPGIAADLLLMRLDLAGIAVSAGSACSAGKISSSPVLEAMGIDACLARGAIRISQGLYTENHHIDRFLAAWGDAVRRVLSHEVTAMIR